MFIGHYALGLGAKRFAPAVSLGTLFIAVQFADLLWPTLLLLGLEQVEIAPGITAVTPLDFISYPYSHSLVMAVVWAGVFAGVYLVVHKNRRAAAGMLAALVASHWVLDVATHRPDMPITIGGDLRVGLGLWDRLPATLAVEGALFLAGVYLYARSTRAKDRVGTFAFWGLIGFLVVVYLANLFGPPPPSVSAIAWSAQSLWLIVIWGYWIDRHREGVQQQSRPA
ncbi:MAG: hypothetical protein R2834_24735 [Rhodothermales bacterium]